MSDSLADAYGASEGVGRKEWSDRDRGQSWRFDPDLEHALELKQSRPDAWDALGPETKMAAGYYVNDKAAAKAHGIDVSGREQA